MVNTRIHSLEEKVLEANKLLDTPPNERPVEFQRQNHLFEGEEYAASTKGMLSWVNESRGEPTYLLDHGVYAFFINERGHKSLTDLYECGLMRLPYSKCVIEMPNSPAKGDKVEGNLTCMMIAEEMVEDGEFTGFRTSMVSVGGEYGPGTYVSYHGNAYFPAAGKGAEVITPTGERLYVEEHESELGRKHLLGLQRNLLQCFILSTHTRGMALREVDPKFTNKKRSKKGKPLIPKHTLVTVGVVYNRKGEAETVKTGITRAMHLRAGHIRNQRYGTGLTKVKKVYIEPVIVNYVDNEDVPVPSKVMKVDGEVNAFLKGQGSTGVRPT